MTADRGRSLLAWLDGVSAPRVGGICGFVALVLYVLTAAPGVYWQDTGVHQYRVLNDLVENPLGLALSHPLHFHVCRFAMTFSPDEPAYAMNLVSAVAGAIGVGAVGGLLFALTRNLSAALLGAGVLLVAHTYWQMSAITETYTIAAALMTLEWCVLLRYARRGDPNWLILLFLVNGLHVADHLLGLLTFVTYAGLLAIGVFRGRVPLYIAAAAIVGWMLTTMPYWSLVIEHYAATHDLGATLYSAYFGGGGASGRGYAAEVLNAKPSLKMFVNAAVYWGYCFPSAAILVAFFGVARLRRVRPSLFWRVLAAQSVIICLFVMRYTIQDQVTFYVPVCALTAIWFGLGAERLLRIETVRGGRRWTRPVLLSCLALPPVVYAGFPALARHYGWLDSQMRVLPFRDSYSHFLRPWKCGDDSAARFAATAMQSAGTGGWFFANLTVGPMTAYQAQVHGGPAGIRVFNYRECLNAHEPALSDAEVRAQLTEGGTIMMAPFGDLQRFWGDEFVVEKGEPFWRVSLRPTNAPE